MTWHQSSTRYCTSTIAGKLFLMVLIQKPRCLSDKVNSEINRNRSTMISKPSSIPSITTFFLLLTQSHPTAAFLPPSSPHSSISTNLHLTPHPEPSSSSTSSLITTRSRFLHAASSSSLLLLLPPSPAEALVKGNAPPPNFKPLDAASEERRKCRNVEECQEYAEKQEAAWRLQREKEEAENGRPAAATTAGGTRYLELEEGRGDGVRRGDTVEIYFKVLKLGKRSYDGLSGEGTVVFSRGYGLEDDEKAIGDRSFTFTVGDETVIQALNDAIPGMQVGALRRISVLPQKGWNKNTKQCDGGPGGSGAGGDLKTDYVVVPTATMVEQEACFDKTKRPFPGTYAQERRMAQRFDQSLIMEVRLVNILSGGSGVV